MKLRFSLYSLLVTTALFALSITVVLLRIELRKERSLRLELLQRGGILEISDLDKVHVVSVSGREEPRTFRWRVYVPQGRTVTLKTSSKPSLNRDVPKPRIRTGEIVSSARNATDRIKIPPGEHVITYKYIRPEYERQPGRFSIDVRSESYNQSDQFKSNYCDLHWLKTNYYKDLTRLERPGGRPKLKPGSRPSTPSTEATQCVNDKFFVLFRFRAIEKYDTESDKVDDNSIPEVYAWLSTDD